MIKKPIVPINCYFQGCFNLEYEKEIMKCKKKCFKYNRIPFFNSKKRQKSLKKLIGNLGNNVVVTPPFWCDYGYNITLGDYFYSNHNLIITDGAKVTFGNNVFVAPNCCFTTAEHAIDPELRKKGVEIAKPINIGNNVWIGAGSTILAGVTIGDNTVIGAGSLVKKSIPCDVIAVGVPCKVLREIKEEEKFKYEFYKNL